MPGLREIVAMIRRGDVTLFDHRQPIDRVKAMDGVLIPDSSIRKISNLALHIDCEVTTK